MMKSLVFTAVVAFAAAPNGAGPAAPQDSPGPKPGDVAPAFSLQGSDGKVHNLADLKGKTVVVAWYPKAMTSGCTAECKSMKESSALIGKYDVAYFGASVDVPADNKTFSDNLDLDFPLLSDPGKDVAKAYGVVTPEREYASRWTYYIGPDGRILYVDKAIKVQTAGQDIAAKLEELGVKKK